MEHEQWDSKRYTVIHLLRSGKSPEETAEQLGCSVAWVYKWKSRYEQEGWQGLKSRSKAPKNNPHSYPQEVRQLICHTRSELEAQAVQKEGLNYIGPLTVQAGLAQKNLEHVPSTATIDRVLRANGMTNPQQPTPTETVYPRLRPSQPHQVQQLDIVPHLLPGGQAVACFNALDIVSRYPFGVPCLSKRSIDAAEFLLALWHNMGIAHYTQMDNEGCFSGGATHPYVVGKVIRLCLLVGTQPVFTPFYHPKSNGHIERFHQEYNRHVWQRHYLDTLAAVQFHSTNFFADYCQKHRPSPLKGSTPQAAHGQPPRGLPVDFQVNLQELPITAGQVHFIRQVKKDRTIRILNVEWPVPKSQTEQGVWATLSLSPKETVLRVYDNAPDQQDREVLISHPFPLKEKVSALLNNFENYSAPLPAEEGVILNSEWGLPEVEPFAVEEHVGLFHQLREIVRWFSTIF